MRLWGLSLARWLAAVQGPMVSMPSMYFAMFLSIVEYPSSMAIPQAMVAITYLLFWELMHAFTRMAKGGWSMGYRTPKAWC